MWLDLLNGAAWQRSMHCLSEIHLLNGHCGGDCGVNENVFAYNSIFVFVVFGYFRFNFDQELVGVVCVVLVERDRDYPESNLDIFSRTKKGGID